MPVCLVCGGVTSDDALCPNGGKASFHRECLDVKVVPAPSRRHRARKSVRVSFVYAGREYYASCDFFKPGEVHEAICGALTCACKHLVILSTRTARGGNHGEWSRRERGTA